MKRIVLGLSVLLSACATEQLLPPDVLVPDKGAAIIIAGREYDAYLKHHNTPPPKDQRTIRWKALYSDGFWYAMFWFGPEEGCPIFRVVILAKSGEAHEEPCEYITP